ncbi:YicC/YloC family endoribonuclease [Pseudahrensia aquimaris]|uniref:YicC/YloC family endoribonuclease n=1 Tax=Pseudahrensia aquimaris TaxID=744461 RepID=A0ABW3FFZ1_9HYPH
MSLRSMTGFARHEGHTGDTAWAWEIRAVNGKSLDIRLRLPGGLENLDGLIRKACSARLSRGNLQINLSLKGTASQSLPVVNLAALDAIQSALQTVHQRTGAPLPDAGQILSFRGVLEQAENGSTSDDENFHKALLTGLDATLDALISHREAEGNELARIMAQQINEIEQLTETVKADPARTEAAIEARLKEQIARLGDAGGTVEPERLAAEIALLTTRADITEELDRLDAHIVAARNLLSEGSPVGRKLEFLAQEFNREANTLCSKSNAVSITESGLALKVVIDQMREQVLNVE